MSRSRSRLAADWFAMLRENLTTGVVEHEDVAAVTETVTTTVASDIAALSQTVTNNIEQVQIQLAGMSGASTQNWEIKEIDNALNFRHNAKTKAILESSGKFTIDNDLVTFGISIFELSVTSNQTNFDLRSFALAQGWDGVAALTVTVPSGIYISSNSPSVAAMTIAGDFPGSVTLINNGYIIGMGGAGGTYSGGAGQAGGVALANYVPLKLTNSGLLAGGGGGGGAGANGNGGTGGGGGGGRSGLFNSAAGARAGTEGTLSAAGAGGARIYYTVNRSVYSSSMNGGYGGYYTVTDVYSSIAGAAGGNWGANGAGSTGAGGAGGACVTGGSLITWQAIGTRYGGIL